MLWINSQDNPGNIAFSRMPFGGQIDGTKSNFRPYANTRVTRENRVHRTFSNHGLEPGYDETRVKLSDFRLIEDEIPGGSAAWKHSDRVKKSERRKTHISVGYSDARNFGKRRHQSQQEAKAFCWLFFCGWKKRGKKWLEGRRPLLDRASRWAGLAGKDGSSREKNYI